MTTNLFVRPYSNITNALRKEDYRQKSIHILRALLRQATYLPDPAARLYIHKYILSRFRKYQSKYGAIGEVIEGDIKARLSKSIQVGKKSISGLSRANQGDKDCLFKVLCMTYGRIGKRRHELIEPLKQSDKLSHNNHKDVIIKALEENDVSGKILDEVPRMTPKLQALLKSQVHFQPPNYVRKNPKTFIINIPKTNAWGRNMPINRVRNIVQDWYSTVLKKILPPLPSAEWETLGKLASGKLPWDGIPKRRAAGQPLNLSAEKRESTGTTAVTGLDSNSESDNMYSSLLNELHLDPGVSLDSLRINLPKGEMETLQSKLKSYKMRNLDSRMMRRLWLKVYLMCPKMEWNSETGIWDVKWGRPLMPKVVLRDGVFVTPTLSHRPGRLIKRY